MVLLLVSPTLSGLISRLKKHNVSPLWQVVVPAMDSSSLVRFTPLFWSKTLVLLNVTRQDTATSSKTLKVKKEVRK